MKEKLPGKVKLPPPVQLAQIAAALLDPQSSHEAVHLDEAINKAVRLYLRVELFCREHEGLSVEKLALAVGDSDLHIGLLKKEKIDLWPTDVPRPEAFPATLRDFFKLVVRLRTLADCTRRFREFLVDYHRFWRPVDFSHEWAAQARCSHSEAEKRAAAMIQAIKDADKTGGYFSQHQWLRLTPTYLEWWHDKRSAINRTNAKQPWKAKKTEQGH